MECMICQNTLDRAEVPAAGFEMYSMECGCVFHFHCLHIYKEARCESEAMPALPCPNCRQSAVDIRLLAEPPVRAEVDLTANGSDEDGVEHADNLLAHADALLAENQADETCKNQNWEKKKR